MEEKGSGGLGARASGLLKTLREGKVALLHSSPLAQKTGPGAHHRSHHGISDRKSRTGDDSIGSDQAEAV